ncbi:MAG: nucleotidyltransferase domain-containing protein [Bacteroidales bacterium]|nr:nucleotidyltransferase domain-containing protein [Candidatus Colicola caccequi]
MDKEYVLDIVRQYKMALKPFFRNAKVYLYGSYSKGTAHKDSDIDVAVVIPECKADWLDTSAMLWDISTTINSLIEPVLLEKKHPTPLYDDVMRTGIAI